MRAKPVDFPPPNWVLKPNVKQRSAVQEYILASFSLTCEKQVRLGALDACQWIVDFTFLHQKENNQQLAI